MVQVERFQANAVVLRRGSVAHIAAHPILTAKSADDVIALVMIISLRPPLVNLAWAFETGALDRRQPADRIRVPTRQIARARFVAGWLRLGGEVAGIFRKRPWYAPLELVKRAQNGSWATATQENYLAVK